MTKRVLLLLFFLSISSSLMLGQVLITGQIRGVVTDASGGVLPNVAISAESPALMTSRNTKTDVAGGYLFDSLPPGVYKVTFLVSGYKTEVQADITITPGFTATVSPQMSVGANEQSVLVSAVAPVVDTTNNTSTTTFDDALLQ